MARPRRTESEQLSAGIVALVEAMARGQETDAALTAVAHVAEVAQDRAPVPLKLAIPVYRRDCWTCRYCGLRTIAPPVLRYLGLIYPAAFPYHWTWKGAHRAWPTLTPTADHVRPGSKGGAWLDPDNLVTACWVCNAAKSDLTLDELDWKLLSVDAVRSDWDGLTGAVTTLWELAGSPPGIFAEWRRGLSRGT